MDATQAANTRVLEDNGFSDHQVRGIPVEHLRDHIEDLATSKVEHELKTLAWLVHDLVLMLHVAPRYDDDTEWDPLEAFRRVGTMTYMVKVDKGARKSLRASGLLKRVQGYLECGRPYGTGLVCTPEGHKAAVEMAECNAELSQFNGIDDERLVWHCLESVRKFSTHFLAALYENTLPVVVWNRPADLTVLWGVDEKHAPLVSGGLSKLADMGLVSKSHDRYRRAERFVDGQVAAVDWRDGVAA